MIWVRVHGVPPFPQGTRRGWGTRRWTSKKLKNLHNPDWSSSFPTHSAKNAEWMGRPAFSAAFSSRDYP
jgi:hypothetical protein